MRPMCCLAFALSVFSISGEVNLPKVELLGNEYYVYESEKGESIYGIAKKFNWDLDEVLRLNPNAATGLVKGTKIYYPTGWLASISEVSEPTVSPEIEIQPIEHIVKKGETIYGISRQYNIPLDLIYRENPSAKHGIKAGQTLILPQSKESVESKYLYYKIKQGDTLYSLAKQYNTTVEDILKANSGLSEKNFRSGETIRININTNSNRIVTELVEEERLASVDNYKVKKNDTWDTISEKTGVEVEKLKEANEATSSLVKDNLIAVPIVETIKVEREVMIEDTRELTKEGIKEIYDSIHGEPDHLKAVTVALILDDPTSNKDADFTKGFMMALRDMGVSPFKIIVNVIDGRVATNTLLSELDMVEPNLIVATADKSFPLFLADYGETNHTEVINAFDVRTDFYEDNPSIVQFLPPTSIFNELIAERILQEFGERKLLIIGNPDENDGIVEILRKEFPSYSTQELTLSEFTEFQPEDDRNYIVYSCDSSKEEVADILQTLENINESDSFSVIDLVGRPNWVTMSDDFCDKFAKFNVIVPTRVWLDTDSYDWEVFENNYDTIYGGTPVKSFPNFAATGYDIATYFIPLTASNGGDYNVMPYDYEAKTLQSQINLRRVNNWGGFINSACYLLQFMPDGSVRRTLIK